MKAHSAAIILASTIAMWLSAGSLVLVRGQGAGRGAAAPSPYPVVSGKAYQFEKITNGIY